MAGGEMDICIGIPTLNGPDRLRRCLKAIEAHTPRGVMQATVLISDDCSYEKNRQANIEICGEAKVEMIMSDVRLGVAAQWNRLTNHTKAPVMILMNDDVEVVSDWLEALVFSLKNNPHAGMIGLKAYQGVNSLNFTPPPVHSYNEAILERGVGMVSSTGFLFGFMRDKYVAINGFDQNFFAFYEEIDFGVRLWQLGWPSYILSYPIVIHQGGATTSDQRNIDARKVMIESRQRFGEKYPGGLREIRKNMAEPPGCWPKPVQWNTMLSTWED